MTLVERLLRHAGGQVSGPRREWAPAALAELQVIEGRWSKAHWTMGAGTMIIGDLLEQSFFPGRRDPKLRAPAGFAALLGLLLLAGPAAMVAFGWAGGWRSALAGVAVMLALWVNGAMILRPRPLGGLLYAVNVHVLPLNLAVTALAVALGGALM